MRIDFVIAGTQKAGTTALDEYLRRHPEVGMGSGKELHFFDHEANFSGDAPDYARYHACFDWSAGHQVRGEATPVYMYWLPCPGRLREYNPDLKIIMILRDPVARAYSHWHMERARGADTADFRDAIRTEAERCRAAAPLQHRVYSYADRGFYSRQLQRMWQYFPRRQTLVLKHEDLLAQPARVLGEVWEFIGVQRSTEVPRITVPSGGYEKLPDPETFEYLKSLFQPEVRALEQLLDWDCGHWLQG